MTTVSRKLNILCIMFKVISFFIIKLFAMLYERVDILLTCGKHLHDRIISLRGEIWTGEVWAHKTNLTPPHFIEVSVLQESQRSYICVLRLSVLVLSTILIFDFGIVPIVWYFLFFVL